MMVGMRGVIVTPGRPNSLRLADDLPEPDPADGAVLVEGLAVGVCGTDREIITGGYGTAPAGATDLVLGHESLGQVLRDDSGTHQPGTLIAGIVRRPDPVPCVNCAAGEWDMCRNGRYTECGIKGRHGFARERWRVEPDFCVPLDPGLRDVGMLLEPTSVVAKAWEHVERIGSRAVWSAGTCLVTGAGPIGLLAALLGVQRGVEVHVLDKSTEGPKAGLVEALGAKFHTGALRDVGFEPDVVIECTGSAEIVFDAMEAAGPDGIVCLTGVTGIGRRVPIDAGALDRQLVLENNVVFGSVNANRRHWQAAADALAHADPQWLAGLVNRRVPLDSYADAYAPKPTDVKVVLTL